jgi:RES domain-containing protein
VRRSAAEEPRSLAAVLIGQASRRSIYLSFDSSTALAEYQQTSQHLPPTTICSYIAVLPALVDLRTIHTGRWNPIWHWNMDWREAKATWHIDPQTWDMGDMAIDEGMPGIIFPAAVYPDGVNVVLFLEALRGQGTINVNDPSGDLPKNQDSWSSAT